MQFKVGDYVTWKEGYNQFRNTYPGTIIAIHKDIATIDDIRKKNKTRKVPIKNLILLKSKNE